MRTICTKKPATFGAKENSPPCVQRWKNISTEGAEQGLPPRWRAEALAD
jgi:hypothetical protein